MHVAAVWIWVVLATEPPLIQAPDEPTRVFRLAVTPAAVPARKLQYELLPPHRDRTPGNAVVEYLRAATQMPHEPRREPEEWQARYEMLDRWRAASPHKVPIATVKRELKAYDKALATADRAARHNGCDWQHPPPSIKSQFTDDLQPLREIVSWLRLRAKVEFAEGRHDDALRTLQTAFQMARHVGNQPTLIQSLVGVAIAAYAMESAADFATVPGGPNLYWALAALPDPLLDLRATVAGESEVWANTFPGFVEFEKGPVSEKRAWEIVESMRKELQFAADAMTWFTEEPTRPGVGLNEVFGSVVAFALRDPPTEFEATVRRLSEDFAAVARAPAARTWLNDRGVKQAEKMPPLQAAYLASWLRYRERFDDTVAAIFLPTDKALAHARDAAAANKKVIKDSRNDPVARALLITIPGLEKVLSAHIRMRRQLAALRAVEALRAHLAVSDGQFPKSWAEVTVVPVPDDPLTGKPFEYSLRYEKATITAPPPAGETPHKGNNFRYELTARSVK